MSQIPTKARELVRDRQHGQCARCGANYTHIHHRQRRREGKHGVANLVGLCSTDHVWVHAHPKEAQASGYIIPVSTTDITNVPIRTFRGWVTYDNDGGIQFINPPEGDNSE